MFGKTDRKAVRKLYSSELKKGLHFGNLNLENPIVELCMSAISEYRNRRLSNFRSTYGNRIQKIKLPVSSRYDIDCYVIEPEHSEKEVLPVIVYFHGGGFTSKLQELMFHNGDYLAGQLKCRIFLPEYRVAPKVNCPVILQECYRSLCYIVKNAPRLKIDPKNLFVYGDSAGGCIAASVTQMCRDKKGSDIKGQLLIYPATDNSMSFPSMDQFAYAPWSKSANGHMWNLYLRGCTGKQVMKYAVPLKCRQFKGLPDAYVEVAEIDILRDEGIQYANRLKRVGVPVQLHVMKGAYHGFDSNYDAPMTLRALDNRLTFIRERITYGS